MTCDLRYDGLVCLEDLVGGLVSVCCPDMTSAVILNPHLGFLQAAVTCDLRYEALCVLRTWWEV